MIVFGWNPIQKTQSTLFVEDDIEMSPLYYWFLDFCLRRTSNLDNIIGCSFYSPKVNELSFDSKYEWDPKKIKLGVYVKSQLKPFLLFQLPSSWGVLYKADHWSEFQRYFLLRSLNPKLSLIRNVRSNNWEKSWKRFIFLNSRFMIEFNFLRNKFLLYSCIGSWSFSTNYFQPGVHTNQELADIDVLKKHDYRFTVPIILESSFLPKDDVNLSRWDEFGILNVFHEATNI